MVVYAAAAAGLSAGALWWQSARQPSAAAPQMPPSQSPAQGALDPPPAMAEPSGGPAAGGASNGVAGAQAGWESDRIAAIETENRVLHDANTGLARENEALRSQLSALLKWILDNFRGRYPVPEHLVQRLDVPALTEEFRVHDDLAALLRMTPEERARLDAAFQSARLMADAAEAAVTRAAVPSASELVIEIPPHEEQGDGIRRHLMAALDAALGTNRAPWAAAAAARDFDRRFGSFGREHRTVRFELAYPEGGGEPWIRIRDERMSTESDGRQRRESVEMTTERLPPEYEAMINRLPP